MAFASKKRSSDEDDFETLRQYILECPFLAGKTEENSAVKAALAGLDHELKRRERDAKLQRKFVTTGVTAPSKPTNASKIGIEDEWQSIDDEEEDRKASLASLNRQESPDEDEVEIINAHDDADFFGKKLAEAAIASIAESQARAKTPIAAVAMALHAAMRSDLLGFACMNATDDGSKPSNSGFAAPIRELPKAQFLPKGWDKHAQVTGKDQQRVVLRYRKNGTGSVLLKVEIIEKVDPTGEETISVTLIPATTQEPPTRTLAFPLDRHVNLDSMTTALRSAEGKLGVHPALHYKALPDLMTEFATIFDLGAIHDDKPAPGPKFLTPPIHATCGLSLKQNSNPLCAGRPLAPGESKYGYDTPTIGSAFPQTRPQFIGDFSGDLVPGGMPGMHHIVGPGNMMGPNHPAFHGGGMTGVGDGSGFGMRPRFDPFGPPGGPQEIPNGGGGIPGHLHPRSSGDPNPDHLKPPNSFNTNNMFS
jgi:hypothetical protein